MLSDINVKGTNHKIGGGIADGQWVSKSATVFSGVKWTATGTYQYTVQDYLPDDTYTYEVIVMCYATTGDVSGDSCAWWVREAVNNNFSQVMGYGRTRTNSYTVSGNAGILPLKQENGVLTLEVSVTNIGSAGTNNNGLYLSGYRRLGSQVISEYYTLTINPTPADATVTFDKGTVSGNSCTVTGGTRVTYTVSKAGYTSETATVTVTADQTVNVTLVIPYTPNQVLYESSTGGASTTLNLLTTGRYQVICVGGGSGGAYVYSSKFSDGRASGGSGAGFNGVVYLSEGNYTVEVGAGGSGQAYETNGKSWATSTAGGQSAIDSIIVAGGGGSATAGIHGAAQTAGSGGTLSYDSSKVQSYSLATNGNAGTTAYNANIDGGASVYGGYGKGGNAGNSYTTAGGNGYVKVVYIGV